MAAIGTKFGLGKAGGVHFTDPREFFRQLVLSSSRLCVRTASATQGAEAAAFWTEIDVRGVADDTNWTSDTYKTILSVSSGIGLVSNIIGPVGLSGTPTTTFRITVDGVQSQPIPVVATTTGQRAMLGPSFTSASQAGSFYTAALIAQQGATSINAAKDTQYIGGTGTNDALLSPWQTLRLMGTPCLIYRQSLLIEMKSSESNSTTANRERSSGVQYMSLS